MLCRKSAVKPRDLHKSARSCYIQNTVISGHKHFFGFFQETVCYIFLRGDAHHFIEYSSEMRYAQIAGGRELGRMHSLAGMNRFIY